MKSSVMNCSSGWTSVSDAASCEFVSPADRISYLVSLVNMPSQGSRFPDAGLDKRFACFRALAAPLSCTLTHCSE